MEQIAGLGRRAVWLILVPTTCAATPLVLLATKVGSSTAIVLACVPVISIVFTLAFRYLSTRQVSLWPLMPYFVVASCLPFLTSAAYTSKDGDEIDSLFTMILALLAQPILAFVGGTISFIFIDERRS